MEKWICKVIVGDYDEDWSFYNRKTGEWIEEGSVVLFEGETEQEAFKAFTKAFTDTYTVEGYYKVFGDFVPNGYRHVKIVREMIHERINKYNNSNDDVYLDNGDNGFPKTIIHWGGNWDVEILIEKVLIPEKY